MSKKRNCFFIFLLKQLEAILNGLYLCLNAHYFYTNKRFLISFCANTFRRNGDFYESVEELFK